MRYTELSPPRFNALVTGSGSKPQALMAKKQIALSPVTEGAMTFKIKQYQEAYSGAGITYRSGEIRKLLPN